MGGTAKNVWTVFDYVASSKCLFMLDELDCISIRRSGASDSEGGGEMSRVTITLLQCLDRLPNDIVLIAATNRIDRIDEAICRRFTTKHEMLPLTVDENRQLVQNYLADINIRLDEAEIDALIATNINQASLINNLIRCIAEKI